MRISLPDFTLAYDDRGDGQPLLFIHGYPLSRRLWAPQVEGLSHHARIITFDLRGHGESDPAPGPYNVDLLAGDCAALLDALGTNRRVIICGLSMGGYIAFAFLRNYPQQVAGLVLASTRAGADSPDSRLARKNAMLLAQEEGPDAIAAGMLLKMFAPDTYALQPELVETARRMMETTSLNGVLGDLAALMDRPDSTPDLPSIAVPTLVIHGDADQITVSEARAMAAAIPGAQLSVLPAAGHLLNMEQPDAFNHAILAFMHSMTSAA
jgi:pimeloyl-ACP methyl ester carboxylesterase